MLPKWFLTLLACVLSAGLLLQAVLLVRLLWVARRGFSASRVRKRLCDGWGRACCACMRREQQDDDTKRFDELVRKQVDDKRVVYARRCLMVMLVLSTTTSARNVMMIASGALDFLTPGQALVSLMWYLLSLGLILIPTLTKAHILDVWHCIFMLCPILWVSPLSGISAQNLMRTRAGMSMISIFLGLLNLNSRVSFFTFATLSVLATYNSGASDLQLVSIEVMMVFAQTALIYSWEIALYEGTRRQLEAKSTRGQQAAVSSLLGMICDSVVVLDKTLKLVEHAPSLANALFHGNGSTLKGMPLENYIVDEEDKEIFRKSMEESSDELASASAGMFHTRLRDAWGNSVQMEVFHVPFPSMDDNVHHLVGLKEPTDAQPAPAPQGETVSDMPAGADPSMSTAKEPAEGGARPTSSITVGLIAELQPTMVGRASSRRSKRSGSSASSQRTGESNANCLQLDTFANPELEITNRNPAFEAKYGSPTTMAELIPEPQEFIQWLSSIADEVYSGAQGPGIKEFASLMVNGCGGIGQGSSDTWRVKVNFPSPTRKTSAGLLVAPDRSRYQVGLRLCKERMPTSSGTRAMAEHQALPGRAVVQTKPAQLHSL